MDIRITIPDEKKNDLALKRMDLLEKKLDAQYKSFADRTAGVKTEASEAIQKLQSSFMGNFNKMMDMHKSMMTLAHRERIDTLRDEFSRRLEGIEKNKNSDYSRVFTAKLNSLESAIKGITLKPSVVKVQNGNNKPLFDSFNGILQRLETLIRESKPRMYPSPS